MTTIKWFILASVWLFAGSSALAQEPAEQQTSESVERAENAGMIWFDRMSEALRSLNFEATLVQTQGDRIQPMLWMHGRHTDDLEVELLIHLNGADIRILRLGDHTSYYFQPTDNSYSLQSDVTYGLLPVAFYEKFEQLQPYYQVLAGRGMRVTGRDTQYLRLVSRDNSRYHYSLWVDRESGMLMKMQMMAPQGEVLEQIQLTSFQQRTELPVSLSDLRGVQRPPRLHDSRQVSSAQLGLTPGWMPDGFELQRSNHRYLYDTQVATDYFLYSDGLTEVSVYLSEQDEQGLPPLAFEGPESFINTVVNGHSVTVVGKLPLDTLRRIAENISTTTAVN